MTSVLSRGAALFDERDYNHAGDNEYKNYREQANRLHDKRNQLSQASQDAFKAGDKQRAHELSEKLKEALEEAENCNKKAAEYVFMQNNSDSAADEIDLHGLYVKEAKWILEKRISEAIARGQPHLRVIVGKGLHSQNGVAKLKPAIDEMCRESNLKHHIDSKNAGVLVIDLKNTSSGNIPAHWDNAPVAHQPYQQQQPQYHNLHNNNNGKAETGNPLVDLLLKLVCSCLK